MSAVDLSLFRRRPTSPGRRPLSPMTALLPTVGLQGVASLLEPSGWGLSLSLAQVLVGALLLAAGAWLVCSAERELVWNAAVDGADALPRVLVTRGAYRLTRHPVYLGLVLVLCSIAVVLGSVLAGAIAVVYWLWLDAVHVPAEEAHLATRFGKGWQRYCARVRRWF